MRILIAILILTAAAPAAAAQPLGALERDRDARLAADRQARLRREVALQNELAAQAARAQGEVAVSNLSTANARPAMPQVRDNPKAAPPELDLSQFAQIPDATLSASNARAVAASQNRK